MTVTANEIAGALERRIAELARERRRLELARHELTRSRRPRGRPRKAPARRVSS